MTQKNCENPKVTIGCGCASFVWLIVFLVSIAYISEIKGCLVDVAHACRGEVTAHE